MCDRRSGKRRSTGRFGLSAFYTSRRFKPWLLALAAMPLFQSLGCFSDFTIALNFELQSLVNTILINAANTVIQNILGL